jgi:hypothetical protein
VLSARTCMPHLDKVAGKPDVAQTRVRLATEAPGTSNLRLLNISERHVWPGAVTWSAVSGRSLTRPVLVTVVIAWQGRLRVIVLASIDLAHQLGPSAR